MFEVDRALQANRILKDTPAFGAEAINYTDVVLEAQSDMSC